MLFWPLAVAMLAAAVACSVVADMCRDRFSRSVVRHMLVVVLLSATAWALLGTATLNWYEGSVGAALRGVSLVPAGAVAVSMTWLARTLVAPDWRPRASRLWTEVTVVVAGLLVAVHGPERVAGWGVGGALGTRLATTVSWDRVLLTVLMLSAVVLLLRSRRSIPGAMHPEYRLISAAFLLAACTAGATVPEPDALGEVDYAALGGALAALLVADRLIRRRLLPMAPPSAEHVLDALGDAVVVLAPGGEVLMMNPAGRALVAGQAATVATELLLGRPAGQVLHPAVTVTGQAPGRFGSTVRLPSGTTLDLRAEPLLGGAGNEVGVVVVGRDVTALMSHLRDRDLALAEAGADLARLLDEEDQLRERLAEQEEQSSRLADDAARDPLTGVHNRRHLQATIRAAMDGGRPGAAGPAVLVLDVDHFKDVNDTYGHPVGDRVLQAVAGVLEDVRRGGETVVRYGGEEFVLVLPGVGAFEALRRAEEVRAAVARVAVPVRDDGRGATVSVTVSVGIGCYPDHGRTPQELLLAADTAMFSAKAAGRDCVVSA